ncbi:efflux RND transporter periplasmic adaptor subunit [Pedobacter sp. AW31-3R]|uniref:efflux RND transporter periplasmic adaptor subunit n=1 Tax=Pedobacter sp. AW31-3R TaxID=3445781 RepID=UPI003F9F6815
MKLLTYKLVFLLLPFLVIASCSEEKKEQATEETSTETGTQELSLSPQQMQSVGITIGKIERKNLNSIVKANGQLAVPPQNKADVSVLSGGMIRDIRVLEGQRVSHGQVLATVENQELIKIQQDYLGAKNNFSYVQAEYKRQQQLAAAGAGTGKFFQAAEASYHAELSKINAYESQLRQLGIAPAKIAKGHIVSRFPLISPISGTVGQISANIGAFVQPGTSIMEVVDNSKIHCDLIVFEKDLMKVKLGQQVDFQLTNQENEQIKGKINGINKSFENESKGVIVHAVIENPARLNLIPGMYVTALIGVGAQLSDAVPVDAVVRSEGKEYIFVVDKKAGDKVYFRMAEVKTGVAELGYIQIMPMQKLDAGVEIAKNGAFYLQSKSTGGAEEE